MRTQITAIILCTQHSDNTMIVYLKHKTVLWNFDKKYFCRTDNKLRLKQGNHIIMTNMICI